MKRFHFLISIILFVMIFFLTNGFTQDYVHYKTFTGHTAVVVSVVFSPDGRLLASGSEDDTIVLWNVNTGVKKKTLHGHKDYVSSVAFSPDGQLLASTSGDGTMRLWDANTGQNHNFRCMEYK